MEIINNIRHRNLVVLRGCCVANDDLEGHQRFLIYDFSPNGSLDDHIFGRESKLPLSWPQRKNIVLGTAKGLAYFHYGVRSAIYHRDIKATNILLVQLIWYRPSSTHNCPLQTTARQLLCNRTQRLACDLPPLMVAHATLSESPAVVYFANQRMEEKYSTAT